MPTEETQPKGEGGPSESRSPIAPMTPETVDLIELNEALERLSERSERQARIVEMRFFSGMTIREVADVLCLSTTTVEDDWYGARAWFVPRIEQRRMKTQHDRVMQLFHQARKLPAHARPEFLATACGGDVALQEEVASLLAHHDCPDGKLESGKLRRAAERLYDEAGLESAPVAVPKQIGPFAIEGRIASGGMGLVYRATQEDPHRTVAVKVMRRGLESKSARQRFDYEVQLLARLRHPGIAQVFQAGTYQDGGGSVPFFAMEYLADSYSIVEYAQHHGLTITDRLNLFAGVCDAVEHGHRNGVIHRDLKPSNILVDNEGHPKVIDFGVACATDSDITTLQTEDGATDRNSTVHEPRTVSGQVPRLGPTHGCLFAGSRTVRTAL